MDYFKTYVYSDVNFQQFFFSGYYHVSLEEGSSENILPISTSGFKHTILTRSTQNHIHFSTR